MQPQAAQACVVAHGGGKRQLFDRRAVVLLIDGEPQFIGMIAVDRSDEVDVRAVRGEALDVDLHAETLNCGILPLGGNVSSVPVGRFALS